MAPPRPAAAHTHGPHRRPDEQPPPQVSVQLLGGFGVVVDGRPVVEGAWPKRRAAELVKVLALAPGHRLHREHAAGLLWPQLDHAAAMANQHKAAHHARVVLGAREAVVLRGGVVALWPDGRVETDVERFELAARSALAADDPRACARVADACPGELLPEDCYADWARDRRERVRQRRLELLCRARQWADVVALEPTDERAHRELMRHHALAGNRSAAVRQFRRLCTVLRHELGVRPAPETVAVFQALLSG